MNQPEVFVPRASIVSAVVLATLLACVGTGVRQYGQYTALGPRVAGTPNERLPLHVNVDLARPANVAVFYVVPGRGTTLLFPEDSIHPGYVEAGTHQLTTALARQRATTDSSLLIRRPAQGQPPISGRGRIACSGSLRCINAITATATFVSF